MKRNNILVALAVAGLAAAAMQVQAQGITVNKKGGESVAYPAAVFDRVTPVKLTTTIPSGTLEEGALATLQYEKLADMKTARMSHQVFPSGTDIVVVGGHTTGFLLTTTAEIYRNGQWSDVAINSPHDGGFSLVLPDGRIMVGGGFSRAEGNGQTTATDIYSPATRSFAAGPDMKVARAFCNALSVGNGVFVDGNWYASCQLMDYYNGSAFSTCGDMDPRSNPYMFADKNGNIYSLSVVDNYGRKLEKQKNTAGILCQVGDYYDVSSGTTYYYYYSAFEEHTPLELPADFRPQDCRRADDNGYYVLAIGDDGKYLLTEVCPNENTTYMYYVLDIPKKHPTTGATITYRGGVYVNNQKKEVYLLGFSGNPTSMTVHVISFNYSTHKWTLASCGPFKQNLSTASWTLLSDGRMACTGGNINDNYDAQPCAYLFTLPTAGETDPITSVEWGVKVHKKDGSSDQYLEKDLESITTYEESTPPHNASRRTVQPVNAPVKPTLIPSAPMIKGEKNR